MTRKFGFLSLVLLVVLGLTQRGHAQDKQLAWDPSTDNVWTVNEYVVYRNGVPLTRTSSTFAWVPVAPGETVSLAVSSYGWRLDANFNTVWAEGPQSSPISYTGPVAPPPPTELCGVDGYGDGIDNDGDGLIDETCAQRPPEQCAPDGSGNGVDEDFDGLIDEGCILPPPPPPAPKQCVTNGLPYPVDALLPPYSGKPGQVDAYILARQAEGWAVFSKKKVKSLVTVQMICRGL